MADINVTGKGTFAANDFTVPAGDNDVTFHSADDPVIICFTNSDTFGQSSLSLGKGGSPTALTIVKRDPTNYTVHVSTYQCSGAGLKDDTTYTIDMSSLGGHPPHYKR